MTITGMVLPAVSVIALVLFGALIRRYIYDFSERTLKDVLPFLRRVVLGDLQNLLHPEVEDYIRTTVSQEQFKKMQWKRIRLTLQYLGDLAENAKVFHAWGKYERRLSMKFPDAERKRASLDLITACVQSQICLFLMTSRLHCWLVRMAFLPFLPPPSFRKLLQRGSFDVFVFYEQVQKAAGELSQAYGESFYQELLKAL